MMSPIHSIRMSRKKVAAKVRTPRPSRASRISWAVVTGCRITIGITNRLTASQASGRAKTCASTAGPFRTISPGTPR
jgi:hypothetical protein